MPRHSKRPPTRAYRPFAPPKPARLGKNTSSRTDGLANGAPAEPVVLGTPGPLGRAAWHLDRSISST